ncbi:ATP-dependent RNA helicase, partial [Plasmodium cynomolgi strain B]
MEIAKQLTYGLNLTRCLKNEDLMSLKRENLKPLKNIFNISKGKDEEKGPNGRERMGNHERKENRERKESHERTAELVSFSEFCADPSLVASYMKGNKINVEFVNMSGSVMPIRFFEDISRELSGEEIRVSGIPTASVEGTTLPRSDYQKLINTVKGTFGFKTPTNIQKICIPTIMSGWNTICISQTGSGKTCAFLIPLLVRLICSGTQGEKQREEKQQGEKQLEEKQQEPVVADSVAKQKGPHSPPGRDDNHESDAEEKKNSTPIRSLILVPTNELASQIHEHALVLFEAFPQFTVLHLTKEDQVREEEEPIDVCICTPLILIHLIEMNKVTLSKCMLVVFDEVDKLFEVNFLNQVKKLLVVIQRRKMQKVFTTATLPGNTRSFISTLCPTYALVYFGQSINSVNRNVKQELLYVNSEEEKGLVLRNLVLGGGLHIPVLVFVNGVEKAKKVHATLRRAVSGVSGVGEAGSVGEAGGGVKAPHVSLLTSERTKEERMQVFKHLQEGHVWYLVCTDVLSRGIDIHGIETVINYDVCYDKYSYIHRVGRACRSDAEG